MKNTVVRKINAESITHTTNIGSGIFIAAYEGGGYTRTNHGTHYTNLTVYGQTMYNMAGAYHPHPTDRNVFVTADGEIVHGF